MARWIVIGLGKRAAASVGTAPAAVLAVGTAVYVVPFVLFAWLAGWLADRYSKRSVVISWKFAEILIGIVAALAVAWGAGSGVVLGGIPLGLWLLLGVVGLFGLQTTLLNPSLLGTIPETVPPAKLSSANGIFAACVTCCDTRRNGSWKLAGRHHMAYSATRCRPSPTLSG